MAVERVLIEGDYSARTIDPRKLVFFYISWGVTQDVLSQEIDYLSHELSTHAADESCDLVVYWLPDPPENCYLTVKICQKFNIFSKKIAKNFHFFQKIF